MSTTPIYTTGDGTHKQYSCRNDGVWFARFKRINAPGWSAWGAIGTNTPIGLYKIAGAARLPARNDGRPDTKAPPQMWYDAI